jgi:hypothetical protein
MLFSVMLSATQCQGNKWQPFKYTVLGRLIDPFPFHILETNDYLNASQDNI